MNEAVFISDLHLHPNQPEITRKFRKFIQWAGKNTHAVYILICLKSSGLNLG